MTNGDRRLAVRTSQTRLFCFILLMGTEVLVAMASMSPKTKCADWWGMHATRGDMQSSTVYSMPWTGTSCPGTPWHITARQGTAHHGPA